MSNLSRETPKRPELPPSIPPFFRELMERCWHPDALQRPSFEDIAATMKDLDTTTVTQMLFNQMEDRNKERALLNQILPPRVAAALKEGRAVEPETYDSVTIFFSDIGARAGAAFSFH